MHHPIGGERSSSSPSRSSAAATPMPGITGTVTGCAPPSRSSRAGSGARSAATCAEELASFHGEVSRLSESLSGEARFSTMEDWLSIVLAGDRRGGVELSCEVRDQPGIGNTLAFRLALDQTYLRPMVEQLRQAVAEFPVIGRLDG